MKDEKKNQKEINAPLFTKGATGCEFRGELFEDPVRDAVNGALYSKRDPYYWNYTLTLDGAKKLIAFCQKYVEKKRHGWQEVKEFLETQLLKMYPYCSFVDFNRLRNLQDTDDMKKCIRCSKASEELSEYAYEFEAVLIAARQLQENFA